MEPANQLSVGLVQLNSRQDKAANLEKIERFVREAASRGAELVALPEYATYQGPKEGIAEVAEYIPGPTTQLYSSLARELGIYFLAGSLHELSEDPQKFYNTSTLYDPSGTLIGIYRKIHLFDVTVDASAVYSESECIRPGSEITTVPIKGRMAGMSICYDLRFPELYRIHADRGAEILFVPASFNMFTGKDHWELLLRARAVENQCFVVAPGQIGRYEPNGWSYGRSLIADPWGNVIAQASDTEGVTLGVLDFTLMERIRRDLPALRHRRLR
jgi:predicted amidohydrolase